MRYVLTRYHRRLRNAELLADLRRATRVLGKKTVTFKEFRRAGSCSPSTLVKHFGCWNKALRAAGLEVEFPRGIPDKELFKNLARVWRALGRQPSRTDLLRSVSAYSSGTYVRRFGGWRRALATFVAWANRRKMPVKTPTRPAPPRGPRIPGLRLRFACFKRDFFKCQACGRSPANDPGAVLHLDHKIPWSAGGPTTLDNLITLCDKCNFGKGASAF